MTKEELKQEAIQYACNAYVTRGKGYKRVDRKERFKQKRKLRGSFSFEIPAKPYHAEINIKGE